jgi:hypothetical protein
MLLHIHKHQSRLHREVQAVLDQGCTRRQRVALTGKRAGVIKARAIAAEYERHFASVERIVIAAMAAAPVI